MRTKKVVELWSNCLRRIISGQAGGYVVNPAIQFTAAAKAGEYESLSEAEYNVIMRDCEDAATLWNNRMQVTAGELFLKLLERAEIPEDQIDRLAARLVERYVPCELPDDDDDLPGPEPGDFAPVLDETGNVLVSKPISPFASVFGPLPPASIRDAIEKRVIGQPEATKAAAMIMYHHMAGRRSNAVFCGPSGCGKSEIWRCLAKEYPGRIRLVDFSRMTAEGWKGSVHLRDVFSDFDPDAIRQNGLIVVLDEADKILCEHAVGGGGTDYNQLVQNSLLKMMDGDVIEFGQEDKNPALVVDCSKVSVVLLGAFERLLKGKTGEKHIGFGAAPKAGDDPGLHKNISYNDLINAGMRREAAGRVNKIVALNPLTLNSYKSILQGPVRSGLEESMKCQISIDDAAAGALAEQAMASELGVRWMRSAFQNAIDDAAFEMPEASGYVITMQDGKLCCQAHGRCSGDLAELFEVDDDMFDEDLPF